MCLTTILDGVLQRLFEHGWVWHKSAGDEMHVGACASSIATESRKPVTWCAAVASAGGSTQCGLVPMLRFWQE